MIDIAKEYTDWLYKNMIQEKIDHNLYEVTTPFLDRHNDYTQIYVKYNDDGSIELNDYGYTIDDLAMSGFTFSTKKRKNLLNIVINKLGVGIKGEVIYTLADSIHNLPEAKHRLLQAMIYINDMFNMNQANVKSFFLEDVTNFFDNKNIIYSENIILMGKSKITHNFDFILPKSKKNSERLVKLMNHPDKGDIFKQIMFSWSDSKATRKNDSHLIVILNDSNKVSEKVINGFNSYRDTNVIPINWSDREKNIELLA